MTFGTKPLEAIEETDLRSLVENQIIESKTIEYKQTLPGTSDSDKKEFLCDVSSFANASGGHLIYGIKEESGAPLGILGLHNIDPDAEVLRLQNLIRDGIDPRIPGVSVRPISLQESGLAIIIRIPRSWASPHMVTLRGHSRFYSRTSAGKYPLDVHELRAAFALSEATAERIRHFRIERLAKIASSETPVPMIENPKIVLHIVSFGAFDPATRFDVSSLVHKRDRLAPIYAGDWSYRHNFDGFLTYDQPSKSTSAVSYLQIFRNGNIEAVEADLLRPREEGKRTIPSTSFEKELLAALPRFLAIQRQFGIEPPLFVMLSLLGVSGYTMAVPQGRYWSVPMTPIDRDTLIIPEVLLESFDPGLDELMKPAFDAVWNAAGWPGSINYNEAGQWVEPK